MMRRGDLIREIERSAKIAYGAHRTLTSATARGVDDIGSREVFLLERGRLAGLLWAAIGFDGPNGAMTFPHATEQARKVATGEISIPDLLNDPLLDNPQ